MEKERRSCTCQDQNSLSTDKVFMTVSMYFFAYRFPHTTFQTRKKLEDLFLTVMEHPPHSMALSPCDYHNNLLSPERETWKKIRQQALTQKKIILKNIGLLNYTECFIFLAESYYIIIQVCKVLYRIATNR